ncbi:E3 ubiquitin-protein ligase RLIM-like [Zingiber officinale]|uniref:RING-type E3 ubiquitin transferase n=1 Tax=Zingiber officinale TaxID=94328 RepID=A0A8J5EW86_ZINOF|nr:E3 ubiquitin-protein ligase RLIM-like [Zingiber officinale]XP_042438318.1 E3 ubiquitin-protein ligase RLIM-like [Zingiber officinale]XP_042438320.1 E3 ubiquitin-protein ligase RLIM-like [Zingiber officinale]KAG6475402.1 hypothetical protein ZIOFF_064621 [Zingiber officinale]
MEHNEVWNHPQNHPRLASVIVNAAASSTTSDIAARVNRHSSFSLTAEVPTCFVSNPRASDSSYVNMSNGGSTSFPPTQVPHWHPPYVQPITGNRCSSHHPAHLDYRMVAQKRKRETIPRAAGANVVGYPQVGTSTIQPSYLVGIETYLPPRSESWPLNTILPGEGSQRNVRSRHSGEFHLQSNPTWFSRDGLYTTYTPRNTSSVRMIQQWSHFSSPIISQGHLTTADASFINPRLNLNQLTASGNVENMRTATNSAYHPLLNQNRNQRPPQFPCIPRVVSAHSASGYNPTYIPSSSRAVRVPAGVEAAASSRYSRPSPNLGWARPGGNQSAGLGGRSHSIILGHNASNRWASESDDLMFGRMTFSSSTDLHDEHRDLRMDIEDMSYEELLALAERIGNVSTGLSKEAVKSCIATRVYHSSQQMEDDEEKKCAICLEEYKGKDNLGRLECGHDFHVGCISEWLRMKNACPICREPASSNT